MPFDAAPAPARVDTPASLLIAEGMRRIATPIRWGRYGLRRWHSFLPIRQYCGIGSLIVYQRGGSTYEPFGYDEAETAMHEAARRRGYPDGFGDLNDHPATTHADVIACMEEARQLAMKEA